MYSRRLSGHQRKRGRAKEKTEELRLPSAGIIQCCRNEMIVASQVCWMSIQAESLHGKVNAFKIRA